MEKPHIQLTDAERAQLKALLSKGKLPAKVFKRATALLELDRGQTMSEVARTLRISYPTILSWRDKYETQNLECLYDAPRSGRPVEIDGEARAKITALACTPAPAGHARWKLDLLAEKAVELNYCEHISGTHVATVLKKMNSSRT
jgi:transposase